MGWNRGRYPASDGVEVFASDPTDVGLEVLGVLTLKSATLNQKLIDKLVSAAEVLGADAIVVEVDDRGRQGSGIPMNSSGRVVGGSLTGVGTRAVRIDVRALKYNGMGTFDEP